MERRKLYGGVVALAGVVLSVIQVIHALQWSSIAIVVVLDAVPMVAVALALAFAGSRLARDEVYEPDVERVLGWTVGGILVFASVAALSLFGRNVATGAIARAEFVAVDHITLGATTGVLVGLYDARHRQRRRELEAERDQVRAFADTATDLNNYVRAIAQSRDLSGVSAFCIEAVSTLLGMGETAVLELGDGHPRIVGNTTGLDDDALYALAETAREAQPGSVTVHDDTPDVVSHETVALVTAHVIERNGRSVLLVSLSDRTDPLGDKDRALLEVLVSHAGMSLEAVESTPASA